MIVSALDTHGRLYEIKDLLAPDQLQEILRQNWLNLPTQPGNLQHRRSVDVSEIPHIERWITDLLPEINRRLDTAFDQIYGQWWLDLPGFHCPLHTDGHLPNALQMYWIAPGEQYGTGFYDYKDQRYPKHQFFSRPNTGYIMRNHANADGSQPLQWHAMLNTVPPNTWRLSSYHIITYR